MALYTVVWEIDIEADSPLEAAKEARQCQHPDTEALYFQVMKGGKLVEHVNLLPDE